MPYCLTQQLHHFTLPSATHKGSSFSTSLPTYVIFWVFFFFTIVMVVDINWCPGSFGEGNGNPFQCSCLEKSHGRRSLVSCSPWGRRESDTTERLHFHFSLSCIGEGNGNPLQCSCLENPRDGGAWWAAVYGSHRVGHD